MNRWFLTQRTSAKPMEMQSRFLFKDCISRQDELTCWLAKGKRKTRPLFSQRSQATERALQSASHWQPLLQKKKRVKFTCRCCEGMNTEIHPMKWHGNLSHSQIFSHGWRHQNLEPAVETGRSYLLTELSVNMSLRKADVPIIKFKDVPWERRMLS